ncbi:MAG: SAM-dependent methyltransferase, partial [Acidimicrobiia bacterium]
HVRIYRWSGIVAKVRAAGGRLLGFHHAHGLHTPYWWLRCLVGPQRPQEDHPLVNAYHRLLVWDLTERPLPTRLAERALNPVLGKSLVLYFGKRGGRC